MQLSMEPLEEMVASAQGTDEAGMDTIWLAEAYPWWRKHGMEARSSTGPALAAQVTKRGTVAWGITTPAFVRLTRTNIEEGAARAERDPDEVDLCCTIVVSIGE